MGWERRKGKLYYYRKQRGEGGRVRSVYLGRGQKAVDVSRADGVPVPDEVVAQPNLSEVPNIRSVKKDALPSIEALTPSLAGTGPAYLQDWRRRLSTRYRYRLHQEPKERRYKR
jgi:hypothetical protein